MSIARMVKNGPTPYKCLYAVYPCHCIWCSLLEQFLLCIQNSYYRRVFFSQNKAPFWDHLLDYIQIPMAPCGSFLISFYRHKIAIWNPAYTFRQVSFLSVLDRYLAAKALQSNMLGYQKEFSDRFFKLHTESKLWNFHFHPSSLTCRQSAYLLCL